MQQSLVDFKEVVFLGNTKDRTHLITDIHNNIAVLTSSLQAAFIVSEEKWAFSECNSSHLNSIPILP